MRRHVAGLDQPGDRRRSGLGIGAHRFLLDGRKPALGIAGGEGAVAQRGVVARRLGHGFLQLGAELGRDRARRHDVLAADQFAGFLEDAGGAFRDELVEGASGGRIAGDPGGAVRAAADRADHELGHRHRHRLLRVEESALLLDPGTTLADRGAGAAGALDDDRLHRPAGGAHRPLQRVFVEALAAERDQQHRPDIRMGAELLHHPLGIGVGVAAGEADGVDAFLAPGQGDLAGDMMGAFDEIGDRDGVADALAPVGPEIAAHRAHAEAPALRSSSR